MTAAPAQRQSLTRTAVLCAFLLLACACFVALGIWQIERLAWKRDLIARVDARVHALPVSAPSAADWPSINRENDEYRRVQVSGTFDNSKESFVFASTELGSGYWVLTPLKTADGNTVLINRGFVPPDRKDPTTRTEAQSSDPVTITGLLRLSEPGGTLLRSNGPQADRWYSRDVAAIAAKRNLTRVAPYFIDADKSASNAAYPVGGMTQIRFPNSHLQYAITWFVMAIMSLGFLWFLLRQPIKNTEDLSDSE
ncbi:surfeit locus 1 family protein [Agrobacterium vitis]|nr:surfeit locus 1 family protein [Agrobacterium vitis]MBE1436689.1 surfeit locus 1 family protein [Agrobacterium vitis]